MLRRVRVGVVLGATLCLAEPRTAAAQGSRIPITQLHDAWRPGFAVVVPAVILLALFAQGFVRLRRRGRSDHAGYDRAALFLLALALGTLALVSPLDAAGEQYLFSAHMLQHVLVGDAAPALALAALRGPLLFFLLPAPLLGPLARASAVRTAARFLVRPRVALGAWALAIGAWHVPAAYDFVLDHRAAHDLEHLSFVTAGVLVWTQLVDPARRGELSVRRRLAFAAALFAGGQILAYVLIFSLTPLYSAYDVQDPSLFGISPLLDQQLAGLVMIVEQMLTLGTCAALLLVPGIRAERARRRTLGVRA